MTYVSYDSFLPEVLPYVHDCPQPVALNAIRNACIEFCEQSQWLVYEHDPVTYTANVGNYEFDPPTDTTVTRLLEAWGLDIRLIPKSQEELTLMFGTAWREATGSPRYYTQLSQDEIILVPKPDVRAANALKMIVVLKPLRSSSAVDPLLYENYAETIAFGARARLYDTPGQPYSDPKQAVKFRAWFESAIGNAKIERNRGLTRANIVARPPLVVF